MSPTAAKFVSKIKGRIGCAYGVVVFQFDQFSTAQHVLESPCLLILNAHLKERLYPPRNNFYLY